MEMQLASERRASRRAVGFKCQVVREDGFVLLGERGVDLSTDGMLLPCTAYAVLGEPLLVTFRVPGTQRWVDTTATVARIVRGHRSGDGGPALGLLFDPLDAESNRLVRWALRRFPPTFPARSMRVDYVATAALIALS
jgi:PilZ domain